MNKKQILMIGGGTAFGAIVAVGILTVFQSDDNKDKSLTADRVSSQTSVTAKNSDAASDETIQGKSKERDLSGEISKNASEIDAAELEAQGEKFRNSMRERQMENLNNKIAKWSAALGLDDQQKEKLLDISASQFDELESLVAGMENGEPAAMAEAANRAMAILSGRALEESMGGILSEDQKSKFSEFGTRQTGARAESRTLRQLATLQEDLMLTPEQRNSAYGIMYEENLKQAEGSSDLNAMIDQFASQSGITLDPSLQGTISALANRGLSEMASGKEFNEQSADAMIQEALNDSVNQQVEQLRPVLTEPQLELYRSQLESRLGGLGNIIPGAGGSGGGN